ncbi:KaiC domain-containing protein [Haloferax sp. S1W]|uniref:KaiC domain-containing protein n=1 Tax=Haloferax sp. S1W TaxID=3377110 RepID=UPI0037C9227C
MSDDDWFERALREADEQSDVSDVDDADGADEDDTADVADDSEVAPGADATEPTPDFDPDAFGNSGGAPDDDPFGTDFATAFENAPSPDTMGGGLDGGESGGPGAGFGFGGGGGGGVGGPEPASFDDEDFESDIDRVDIGISGLDDMILGGVPKRSLMVAIGSAGTGKTTFGLQFLHETLKNGGSGVYITLEESRERILDTADEKGWDFTGYEDKERLSVVDMDPVEMANSLTSIRNDLPRLVEEFGADRLVLDSVSLLEMMYDHPSKRRSEVFDFARSLKDAGVTTMLTSEADRENPHTSRHGLVEYLADAVFVLQYVRPDDFRETRLAIEIQKIRDANHSRETKPYELTDEGISVYRQANIF